ncbi:hypothetical protein ACIA8R_12795 [Nonomuraea sp. NPDC051191]|uniref:hypothetical protein n=1 Tax=Nonomuraea sp. NPDC051191 TaxID=3364372 RepID=UPI0037AAC7F8
MMMPQEELAAARRTIEQVRDQHANDVRKLISLLEDGAMKGKAADKLLKDCQAWEAAYRGVFNRALALVDSAHPGPAKPTDPLGLRTPPLNPPGRAGL